MKHARHEIQSPHHDEQETTLPGNSELAGPGSHPADLEASLINLTRDLKKKDATIDALTAELTANELRLTAILNSRAWRWVDRYSRVKRGYVVPGYEFLRDLLIRAKSGKADSSGNLETSSLARGVRGPEVDEPLNRLPGARLQSEAATHRLADVICFSNMDWDFRYQRPQQIMSQFSEHGHRVFYLRLDRVLSASEARRFSLKEIKENLFQVTLAARREVWINQEDIRGANAEALLDSLVELRQAYDIRDAIGYVMTPSWTSMALEAKRRWGWQLIYDCMDEWKDFPGMGRAITRAEQRLARQCDLLVVSAERLYDKWRGLDRSIALIRNAVDYEFYVEGCRPNRILRDVSHPVIGYFGAISDWFDVELIIHLARKRPRYTFVMLGRIAGADISELERLPNVRLLGQQPYETMPQYLYHFDACLIPFKITGTTEATDPVKVYEYLSSGKPIVSVDLPELDTFRDLLYIGKDRDHFLEQLDHALIESDPELSARRRAFAAENSWKDRYETIVVGLRNAMPRQTN